MFGWRRSIKPAAFEPGLGDSSAHRNLRAHYTLFFGVAGREMTWPAGPAATQMPDFRVLEMPPNRRTGLWTYLSIGAFRFRHANVGLLEFFIMTERQTPRGVELVTMTAHYHAHQGLDLHHRFPIGEPWLPGSMCNVMFVSLPYPFGPELGNAPLGDGAGEDHAHVLWLLPITRAEHDFVRAEGVEALERTLEAAKTCPSDAKRRSVV